MDSGCVHVNFSESKISASALLSALITVYALREAKTSVCVDVYKWTMHHLERVAFQSNAVPSMIYNITVGIYLFGK